MSDIAMSRERGKGTWTVNKVILRQWAASELTPFRIYICLHPNPRGAIQSFWLEHYIQTLRETLRSLVYCHTFDASRGAIRLYCVCYM
jgi:hypothetical protein